MKNLGLYQDGDNIFEYLYTNTLVCSYMHCNIANKYDLH